eukprot:COSAG01_NODE_988_length_12303_cov_5.060472_7_plen_341_part_00
MLAQSHQPLILNVTVQYNSSFPTPSPPSTANANLQSFYIAGAGGDLWLRHCDLVLFGTPVPSKFWRRNPAIDRSDSTFYVRKCPAAAAQQSNKTPERFWLSPLAIAGGSLAPMHTGGHNQTVRLQVVSTAADCATGRNVFERLTTPSSTGLRPNSFRLRSVSPGATYGLLLTLIKDGCSPGPGKPRSCNFSAAGDLCRAAVLAPASTDRASGVQQDWNEAAPNDHASPSPPLPPVPPAFRIPVALDAHASRSIDGSQLSVRVVNPTNTTVSAAVSIGGALKKFHDVKGLVLTSTSRLDDNSPSNPTRVAPKPFPVSLLPTGKATMSLDFPPHSFVTLQFS